MAIPQPNCLKRFFVGVDGGGSSTRVIIASEDGTICGIGKAAGSNPNDRGVAAAASSLQSAFSAAWGKAGIAPRPLDSVFLGIAGSTTFRKQASLAPLVDWIPLAAGAHLEVDNDLRIALAGGLSGRPGIVVIAGTGSAGYGRNAHGQTWQAGGWGSLLDDLGSGYWLGLGGLKALIQAYDGRGSSTVLEKTILPELGLRNAVDIPSWIKKLESPRESIAKLGVLVFEAADKGDPSATAILKEGASHLARIGSALADRLFPETVAELVFTGGTSHNQLYRAAFAQHLAVCAPRVHLVGAEQSPLYGALILAFANASAPLPPLLTASKISFVD